MAWTSIPTTGIDQDSPVTQTLMTAIRDNLILANPFLVRDVLSSDAVSNFTAFDATLYDGYYFVLQNVKPATDGVNLLMRTSTDGGSSYDSTSGDYQWAGTTYQLGGATVTDTQNGNATSLQLNLSTSTLGSAGGEYGWSGTVWLIGPHLTGYTTAHWDGTFRSTAGASLRSSGAGERSAAEDVDAVQFLFSSGNLASGTISMFGLHNATG